jgi:hypothetical protein
MFQDWLLIHKRSLTRVLIGHLSSVGSNHLFNATLFPNLEYLQLCKFQMIDSLVFSPDDATVLGPSLNTFASDFSYDNMADESWWDFRQPEADWLRELAEIAVSCKVALRKTRIIFEPRSLWDTTEDVGHPWDRRVAALYQDWRRRGRGGSRHCARPD